MAEPSLAEARSHNVRPDVFLRHYREIRDCKSAHHDTGMALARAKKAAKGEGIDLDALKLLEKFADLDRDEAEMQLTHLRLYAEWIELPIGTQLDAFGQHQAPAAKPSEAETQKQRSHDARWAGEGAGRAGHERQANRYEPGSAEHVAWDKGWLKGNKTWLAQQKSLAGDLARNAQGAHRSGRRGRRRVNGGEAAAD
ncbi:MAG: hypothetical protein FWD12_01525 [Alphaproteobacteria bacterium]|nr:hypothetical protein [Alphaproteobacteria bacterium]